jgi:urease accessory protein
MRGARPFVFTNLRTGEGVDTILAWIRRELSLDPATA